MQLLKKRDLNMTEGVIWKQLISFSVPMMIGLLFQQLYNMVDTIVVGHFVGTAAQAAVGTTGSVLNMLVSLSAGLSMGAGVVISQAYGAGDEERLSRAVHTTIVVTAIVSVISMIVGQLVAEPLLRLMDTPEEVFPLSETYVRTYFQGIAGLMFYNMGSGILRAVGDSQRPLYFLIFSALLNTVGDLVFVLGFGMGVKGVALATILSQFVSAILVLVVLMREKKAYGIRWNKLCIDSQALSGILTIGLPSSIQQAVTSFSNVFVQSYVNFFGPACMAAWGVYNKLDTFVLIPVQSIAMASTTFVGQNWGAKQPKRARTGVTTALRMSLVITIVLAAGMIAGAPLLVRFFTPDPETQEFASYFLRVISVFYFTICFNQIYAGALRGIGNSTTPTIIMLTSFVAFRQLYLFVTRQLGLGLPAVAVAYPMGWLLCSVLLTIVYRRSKLFRTSDSSLEA